MKVILIWLAVGLTACEKLDRTYLPPRGSITAGGYPEDLDLPLDLPKSNYPSTLEPGKDGTVDDGSLKPNFPNVAFGIDRQGPPISSAEPFATGHVASFANTIKVPTTATSYAFTQTTTLSPLESYGAAEPISTQEYTSKTFPFESNLDQQSNTDFIDTNIPGKVQFSENNARQFGVQQPSEDESILGKKYFSNANYPPTQYEDDVNNISGAKIPTVNTPYPDEYYEKQESVSSMPNKVGQADSINEKNLGTQENFNSKNKYQDFYGDDLPTNDNLRSTYRTRTRPERIQAEGDRNAVILNYENILTPESFAYSFDTSNGIHADESGTAIDGVKAEGSYSYTGDDGKVYSIVYTADENGFLPRGDHLPTAPPIPEAILKVIEQATINKQLGIIDDGSYDDAKYGHGRYQGLMGRTPQVQFNNILGQVQINKGGNIKDNVPANFDKDLDQFYIGDKSGRPYSVENSYSSDDNKQFQDVNTPIFKGSPEQSTDNSELNKEIYMTFRPDYTVNTQQSDKIIPKMANKSNQYNIGLSQNVDGYSPTTTQVANIYKEYGQDINQPSHTGYEYNHPQNTFNYNDVYNLKSRFSNTNGQNGETEPEDKVNIKGTTAKPFITPNVSFNFNSRKTDKSNKPLAQNINRPITPSEDGTIYSQSGVNDLSEPGISTFNENASHNNDKKIITDEVNNREFSTPKPYGSTSLSSQNYEAPYTSEVIDNGRQSHNYPTPTLRSQYDSTTPLSSEISSRLIPSTNRQVYYSQSTPTQYTTTLRPSTAFGTHSTTSRRPSDTERIDNVRIPTTGSDTFVSRENGYPGDFDSVSDGKYYTQPISKAGYQDDLKPRFGISPRPKNFESESTTERIIGEDFSGPKQPQGFDPDRGYYY